MAVAVAVSAGGAVAVAVAGLTKRFLNHIQIRFLNQCLGLLNLEPEKQLLLTTVSF